MSRPTLILASSSPYRQALLQRLQLPFQAVSPDVDESPLPDEAAEALAMRLARAKAEAVAAQHPDAVVVGSDQVPCLDTDLLTKPGSEALAREQLNRCSGRRVSFYSGLCVLAPGHPIQLGCVPVHVQFRQLGEREISRYIALDQPLDCAGSFKWESLGIALFEHLQGDDPTALEGLPLITLCRMLRTVGLDPLADSG